MEIMKREEILKKIDALCIKTKPTGTETQHNVEVGGKIHDSVTILWWSYTSADQNKDGNPKEKWYAHLNVFDGILTGTITGYPEDDPEDFFCLASKTCDTPEKVMEFLEREFTSWTCNMKEESK